MPTATGAFSVTEFTPTDYASAVETALPIGHSHMVKTFTGAVEGRSLTQFSFAFSPESGAGTYVAMEAFEGTVGIDAAQDFEDRFLHRRRGADPHRGRDVEVVSEIIVHAIPTCPAPVGIGGGAALPLRGSVGHPARRVNQGASLGCVGR